MPQIKAYNIQVNGEYTLAKLMEHSWWFNEFVSTITRMLYHNPMRIAWVGDYADDPDDYDFDEDGQIMLKKIYEAAWVEDSKLLGVKKDMLQLDGKFLVNHTDKIYVDCDQYRSLSDSDDTGWIIHPLPILTCIGNGLGCGDYEGINMDYVGSWYMSEISVEDEVPAGYKKCRGYVLQKSVYEYYSNKKILECQKVL